MIHRFAPAVSVLAVVGFMVWLSRSDADVRFYADDEDGPAAVSPRCAPVAWRLAAVDPRFGVARAWVVGAAREAARWWGELDGVPTLVEDEDAGLGIRLVYDDRQAQVDRHVAMEVDIERLRGVPGDSIERLLEAHPPTRFEAAAYREVVREEGGEAHGEALRRSSHFREIRVFAFRDREDLVRILAHEFGHALGLDHVEDPGAVMYAEHDGTDPSAWPVAPLPAERRALEALCQPPATEPGPR